MVYFYAMVKTEVVMLKDWLGEFLLVCLVVLVLLVFSGVPKDALRASQQPAGDRLRYFNYLQTARWYGVSAALEKYGVEPK